MLTVKDNWQSKIGSLPQFEWQDPFSIIYQYCTHGSLTSRKEELWILLNDALHHVNIEDEDPRGISDRVFFVKMTIDLIEAAYIIYAKYDLNKMIAPTDP